MARKGMRLFVLAHGRIENDLAINISLVNVGTVDAPHRPAQWVTVPNLTWLIQHPDAGWILFDTSCHPRAMEGWWPEENRRRSPWYAAPEEHLESRLHQLGLRPGDIDTVIVSHLHLDHAGGISLFAGTRAGAGIIVHRRELETALAGVHSTLEETWGPYLQRDFCDIEGIAYAPVEQDQELADGVEMIMFEGHAAGLVGLMVHLEHSGTILLPSDTLYMRRSLGPPPQAPGIIYDLGGFYRSARRVEALQRRHDATIIYPHDWEQYTTELKLSPAYYE